MKYKQWPILISEIETSSKCFWIKILYQLIPNSLIHKFNPILYKTTKEDNTKDVNALKSTVLNYIVNALLKEKHVMKTVYASAAETKPKTTKKYIKLNKLPIIEIQDFSKMFLLLFQ